ncbi:S41 family peptidase [Paenibacillus agricola]|uniref:PDZ domain-containing protein n=1 Tax=Paenibacillus agricola TaxID=2716264 RepID=A0ABX0J356_9BACL|nr:S41 family peptidase [Paenibacillus agricola]NHN30770.1 PDZ domain-containing protein [Paenibacillus agricola]
MKITSNRAFWRHTTSIALTLSLLLSSSAGAFAAEVKVEVNNAASTRILEALNLLENNHVSGPSKQNLSDAAIKAMVQSLGDPYTVYFTPEELKQFQGSVENNYVGIGIRVTEQPEGVYVMEVFDGPAGKAGVKVGDRIIAVNGESVSGLPVDDMIKKILGPENSEVSVTVQRGEESLAMSMTRQQIQLPVVIHKRFDPGVGYLQVTTFSSEADEVFASQLAELKSQGINSLILDLRDNPGGLLDTAINMAKLFVKEGILIHTKDKDNVDEPVTFSNGTTQPFPLYILVNEYSASASEVLTGALQDYNAVTKVIGMKTYGKGSVQQVVPMSSGGAMKITIEEYLTPKLRKVNKVGISPDVEVDGELPQLVTALHEAGIAQLNVTASTTGITVNGIAVADGFKVIREDGQVYVPSRVLSSLLGGNISWNEDNQAIEVSAYSHIEAYSVASGDLLLRDGFGYVNVDQFAKSYPQLSWTDNGQQLVLSATK